MFFTTGAQLQAAINALPASKVGGFTAFDAFFYGQQYMSAGKYSGTLSPIEHFVQIGAAQGNKPSAAFDPVYYASKYADLTGKGYDAADLLIHFLRTGLDEGRAPNASLAGFDGAAYLAANPDVSAYVDANLAQFGGSVSNGALAHYVKFGTFEGRPVSGPAVATPIQLDTGVNNLQGTAGNDTFVAAFANNANTFQSGDVLAGGSGAADKLEADLGNSSSFAILAATTGIEQVFIRAQSTNEAGSSGNNNVDTTGQKVTVDAEKMQGVTQWWNTDSRADLKIEDIRILDSQITKDITIGMRNTDPGSMTVGGVNAKSDFEVYFSPESLRPEASTSTSALTLVISNPLRVSDGYVAAKPLDNVPYTQLVINVNGEQVLLNIDLTNVDTYAQLLSALQTALAAEPKTAAITIEQQVNAYAYTSTDGQARLADQFVLRLAGGTIEKAVTGWGAAAGLPSDNAFLASVIQGAPSTNSPLITSTIVLDNVGRESEAGDLVIGSMSTRSGVERFEVTVENNADNAFTGTQSGSWLGNMRSTNNILREVSVVNAAAGNSNPDYVYIGTGMDQAGNNLTSLRAQPTLLNTDGLTDVRVFDAANMLGNVKVGASITVDTIRKYQDLLDTATNDGLDNVAFSYTTGNGSDSVNLAIDGTVAGSNSNIVVGRHDFTFAVNTGAGNDTIQVALRDSTVQGTVNDWYDNQAINNNVTINGGEGNDVIRTPGAGNIKILGDGGNDTIYSDNTGSQAIAVDANNGRAVYVFNAVDRDVADLESQAAASISAVNASLKVTFKGFESASVTIADSLAKLTNVTITDLSINQAIKTAINSNEVLNKLLVAEDGPGRTLIVKSLIDGEMVAADLGVSFTSGALSTTQAAVVPALTLFSTAAAATTTLLDGYIGGGTQTFTLGSTPSYAGVFGQVGQGVGAADLTGADSTTTSDNTITGGAGDDVIVLGTTQSAGGATDDSNETVVFAGDFGKDTIVNFNSGALVDGGDTLSFVSYLGGASVGAAADAALVGNLADKTVSTLSFATVNAGLATEVNFAGLNASIVQAALNGTAPATDVGVLVNSINATVSATAATAYVLMVENAANVGEYKVFSLGAAAAGAAGQFTTVQLVGTIDFGASVVLGDANLA